MVMEKSVSSGFTLVELMIVVVIIGILAAIAYPSYQESVRKTKRTDAQGEMMAIANQLQRYKIANFSFIKADNTAITLADVQHVGVLPTSGATLYNLVLSDVGGSAWTLTATPAGTQTGDGHIVLRHNGQRCWTKGTDINAGTACIPSGSTNWDGH